MREAFISILTILAVVALAVARSSDKDGFNFYKDYLRGPGRSDEGIPDEVANSQRPVYYYRTPVQLYPGLFPALEQEYKKRTGNAFKNLMLNKELLEQQEPPLKRSSKAAMALMLQGKPPARSNFHENDMESTAEK